MSRLRLTVVALCLSILAGSTMLGQEVKKEEPVRFKGFLPANYKKLGLSDSQTQNIYKVQNEYFLKTEALKKQLNDLKQQEKDEIEKILTPAQKARLKEIRTGESATDKDKEKPKE